MIGEPSSLGPTPAKPHRRPLGTRRPPLHWRRHGRPAVERRRRPLHRPRRRAAACVLLGHRNKCPLLPAVADHPPPVAEESPDAAPLLPRRPGGLLVLQGRRLLPLSPAESPKHAAASPATLGRFGGFAGDARLRRALMRGPGTWRRLSALPLPCPPQPLHPLPTLRAPRRPAVVRENESFLV